MINQGLIECIAYLNLGLPIWLNGKNMRFGLILGRSAILKKKVWADYEQRLRAVFSGYQGQNKYILKIMLQRPH